uniref:Ribosomal protein S4 n=1 Tax=Gloeotilopsis planctonica TaxID=34157 RepID=A0A1B2RZ03_9CHLO|nr:ribosomal protein S4 [Gloeotilopsis planctonica]
MLFYNKTISLTFPTSFDFNLAWNGKLRCKFSLPFKKCFFVSSRFKKVKYTNPIFFRFFGTLSKSLKFAQNKTQSNSANGVSNLSTNKVQSWESWENRDFSLKADYLQSILLLTKIKKKQKERLLNSSNKSQKQKAAFNDFCKLPNRFNDLFKQELNLKAFSTVSGFKKFMINSVKVSQNQLQPSYNRRKHCHSHYSQIIKEKSHLSKLYGHLSKNQVSTLSAFTLNLQLDPSKEYLRPIPKLVFLLESRLDVILWRNLQSHSIFSAKQTLRKGIRLNGGLQKKPSIPAFPGDVFIFN